MPKGVLALNDGVRVMKVGYLGFSPAMIEALIKNHHYEPMAVFCDRDRASKLTALCLETELPLFPVANDEDIVKEIRARALTFDCLIIHQTSIIIHKPLLSLFDIYNIHLGDLFTNRGAHSLTWTILLGESMTCLSLHQISAEIDAGRLLATYPVPVEAGDDTQSLSKRLEAGLPFILDRLAEAITKKIPGTPAPGGRHRRRITPRDYEINPTLDPPELIRRKINSQKIYLSQARVKIFVTGLCSLQPGRLEFGNIGNYYIVEPFFRELHRVFPEAEISTTFQMTDGFQRRERIYCRPLELYYSWRDDEVKRAENDYRLALAAARTGCLPEGSPFLDEVTRQDLIINLSGDMWGDNATIAGPGRLMVALLRDRAAQLTGRPVAMLAGSPGPFENKILRHLARNVYAGFSFVSNREPYSSSLLQENGFDLRRTRQSFCPGYLFEAEDDPEQNDRLVRFRGGASLLVGVSVCGFNFSGGAFDTWPRDDQDFEPLVGLVQHLTERYKAKVVFISHTNGFDPGTFHLKPGRDFPIQQRLYELCLQKQISPLNLLLIQKPLLPLAAKALIGRMDIYISGRAHGAMAAISQQVPSLMLDYLNGPLPQKMRGFAEGFGLTDFLVRPDHAESLKAKTDLLIARRGRLADELRKRHAEIVAETRAQFDVLAGLVFKRVTSAI